MHLNKIQDFSLFLHLCSK